MARAKRNKERGVALLLVVISIAVLTVVGTDFAYNSRVDMQLAANHRDEIRAYYLARSGIGLSRMLLRFQRQLDKTPMPNLGNILQQISGGASGGAPQTPGPPATLSIQLWRMARVDCHMLKGMVKSESEDEDEKLPSKSGRESEFDKEYPELAMQQAKRSFGGFEGCFLTQISDEEEKLNLNILDAPGASSRALADSLLKLLEDKRFEFLFEKEDSNRVKTTPRDVLLAMKDWIDENEVQSVLNQSNLAMDPFVPGTSDENFLYDRYNPRYRAKNARFDTLDELYMVQGVNDRFMAAFRDRLTVYPDINSRPNINTDDPLLLYAAIMAVSDPIRPDPRLQDPIFVDALITKIRSAKLFAMLGMTVTDFLNVVEGAGVKINTSIRSNIQNNRAVSDKSTTYRIKAVGEAGAVQKSITTVVRLDDGLGRLVYWRED